MLLAAAVVPGQEDLLADVLARLPAGQVGVETAIRAAGFPSGYIEAPDQEWLLQRYDCALGFQLDMAVDLFVPW